MHGVQNVVGVHCVEVSRNHTICVEDKAGGELDVPSLAFDELLPDMLTTIETSGIFTVQIVKSILTYR